MGQPAKLPDWPAALPLHLAAAYCGLSVDTFKDVCKVQPISFTDSSRGDRYLRNRLDEWLLSKDPNPSRRVRRFGEKSHGDESAA
jgi:hypothetical protein